jgi:hypothetical protein
LDIKDLHAKLIDIDKETAFFKSIILLDKKEYDICKKIMSEDPKINRGSTDDMDIHQTFIAELTTICKFDKKVLDELFKGKETDIFSKKISILNDWIKKNKAKEEKKEENKEEEKKEEVKEAKEESKKEASTIIDIGGDKDSSKEPAAKKPNIQDDPLKTFGLMINSSLISNLDKIKEQIQANYNPPATTNNSSQVNLFEKVYTIKENSIIGDYLLTLSSFYKQLCRKKNNFIILQPTIS